MPKKKLTWKTSNSDFTIYDSANAPKPVNRLKKSASADATELSWDQINVDDDIVEEIDEDGVKKFVYKKKNNTNKVDDNIENRPGIVYPEILFYLLSGYIQPEQIGTFAAINKAAYSCMKRETFWRNLYKSYCQNHPRLPQRLRIENSFKVYGLRQRVVRALHHTYDAFVWKIGQEALQDSKPHQLVRRRCVNVWFYKGPIGSYWLVFFKFKKLPLQRPDMDAGNIIKELSRIDANPEEGCQVLQVTCQSFHEVPPLMGMTLTSVSVVLSQGFRCHRLHLGFNTGSHISRDIIPEQSVVIDSVINMYVFDWWHPMYPHFDNTLPIHTKDDDSRPVLNKDFFNIRDGDI